MGSGWHTLNSLMLLCYELKSYLKQFADEVLYRLHGLQPPGVNSA
jgi:hypothetical protein